MEARFEDERRRHEHAEWALRSDITRLADHIDSIGAKMRAHVGELDEKLDHSLQERVHEIRNLKRAMDDRMRPLWDRMEDMEAKAIERPQRLEMGSEIQTQTKLLEKILQRWEDDKPATVICHDSPKSRGPVISRTLEEDAIQEKESSPQAQPTIEEEIAEPEHEMQWDEAGDEVVLTIGDDEIRVPVPAELPISTSTDEDPFLVSDWPYPSRSTGRRAPAIKAMGTRNADHLTGPSVSKIRSRPTPRTKIESSSTSHLHLASPCPSSSSSSSDIVRASSVLTTQPDGSEVPVFFFRRYPDSVAELWAEYAHGLSGQPPVHSLDLRYGVRWRGDQYARTWYSRRNRFWELIKKLQSDGLSEEEALAELERKKGDGTVAKLIDTLAREARALNKERSAEPVVRDVNRKRRRLNIVEEDEEDEDSADVTEDEKAAKRTTPMKLRKRTVGPTEDTSDWDYDENW
ncbi:transcriptional activator of glycolytic enzymes-domain-containing protein [Plectosphaerella plurivora]|uniref:Transcriptional activator of glycolytic enzymes-domain-containing protein n=1 Tax=Plectosphaerella plurivora TaxID=936078 RepID=A0A9P8VJK7_9PEZI|nr:transcriptional activator of glycolytic enzymes-domain-containing protein [Plectosphaerella plurivora]